MTKLSIKNGLAGIKKYGSESALFYPLTFAVITFTALIPYYTEGAIILGGEGNVLINFSVHLQENLYLWVSRHGIGTVNLTPGSGSPFLFLLSGIQILTDSDRVPNFILVFSMFYLPFFGMYLFSRAVGASRNIAFLVALFYRLNPYMQPFLTSLNQWNIFIASIIPLQSWILIKYYKNGLKLFTFYGLLTAFFSLAYTNPPLYAVSQFSIFFSVSIISYFVNQKLMIGDMIRKWAIIFSSFLLFNAWWVWSQFYVIGDALEFYSAQTAQTTRWLIETVHAIQAPVAKALALSTIVPNPQFDFLGFYFNTAIGKVLTAVPFFLLAWVIFFTKRTKNLKLLLFISGLVLLSIFLSKGAGEPFGFVYMFLFKHVPLFNIFKTPIEKFGLLTLFFFSNLLLFTLLKLKNEKISKVPILIFSIYLIFCWVPMASGNILPRFEMGRYGEVTRKYIDKPEYIYARESFYKDRLLYRGLLLPATGNYQKLIRSHGPFLYVGLDPITINIFKSMVTVYSDAESMRLIYNNFLSEQSSHILSLFNIRKIVVNEDLTDWFGYIGDTTPKNIHDRLSRYPNITQKPITIYKYDSNFLPFVHTTSSISLVDFIEVN